MSGVSETDLFGSPVKAEPVRKTTLFGEGLDQLARRRGGWPAEAMLVAVEVIGKGDDPMVLATGGVPVGWKTDGSPKFGKRSDDLKAGFSISEYRAALAKARQSTPAPDCDGEDQ